MTSSHTPRLPVQAPEGIKSPVATATTATITLSGLQTVNGYTLNVNDRVLVKDQDISAENGIYVALEGDWVRSQDWKVGSQVANGAIVLDNNTGDLWRANYAGVLDVGTTAVTFNDVVAGGGGNTTVEIQPRQTATEGQTVFSTPISYYLAPKFFDVHLGGGAWLRPGADFTINTNGDLILTDGVTAGTWVDVVLFQPKITTVATTAENVGEFAPIQVANMAALRNVTAYYDGQQFELLGHTNAGIGGGTFYYDASDMTSTDDNGMVAVTTGEQRLKRKNVTYITPEMFGAVRGSNDGEAFRRAGLYAKNNNIGEVLCSSKVYNLDYLVLYTGVVYKGMLEVRTQFKQIDNSGLTKFIYSENFDAVLNSGQGPDVNPLVPSWFGLINIFVNGNKDNNNTSVGLSIYGASPIIDNVVIGWCGNDGFRSYYGTDTPAIDNLFHQEEGRVVNLICRNNDGLGWEYYGTHNLYIGNYIGCFNQSYGFRNGSSGTKWLGAPTYIDALHCFYNDVDYDYTLGLPRKNIEINENISCGVFVADGGQCTINADNCLISSVKQYLGGQGDSDGLVITGSENQIANYSGIMRNDDPADGMGVADGYITGAHTLKITGNYNSIANCRLRGSSQYSGVDGSIERGFSGLKVEGNGNTVKGIYARDCVTGVTLDGDRNTIEGQVVYGETGFNYVGGFGNRVDLYLQMNPNFGGVDYVVGSTPTVGDDVFKIVGKGLAVGTKRTKFNRQTSALDSTITGVQTTTVTHDLLYTPRREDCTLLMTGKVGTAPDIKYMRVSTTDATEITIEYDIAVAGTGTFQVAAQFEIL